MIHSFEQLTIVMLQNNLNHDQKCDLQYLVGALNRGRLGKSEELNQFKSIEIFDIILHTFRLKPILNSPNQQAF